MSVAGDRRIDAAREALAGDQQVGLEVLLSTYQTVPVLTQARLDLIGE